MNPVCTLTLLLSKPSLLVSSCLRQSVSSSLFPSGFRSKILFMFASYICAVRQTNILLFYLSSWIVFCVRYLRTVRFLVLQLNLYFQWYSQGNICCTVSGTYMILWTKISQHIFYCRVETLYLKSLRSHVWLGKFTDICYCRFWGSCSSWRRLSFRGNLRRVDW